MIGTISWNEVLLGFIGGIAIFIFGMNFLTDGLKALAGKKMKSMVKKYTTNPIKGLLFGIILTIMLQSSTGSIAIIVSLCTAGVMSLRQSLPVLLGANIGSSVTYFIIGFKIGNYALYIIALGVILLYFTHSTRGKKLGQVVFGFGMMFYGLKVMGGGIALLKAYQPFLDMIAKIGANPILGMLLGIVFTAVVHSSAATMGIIQGFYASGILNYTAAFAIALGAGIGTTLTAIMASRSGTTTTKKAAVANTIYNIIGTAIFLLLATPYYKVLSPFVGQISSQFQIAMYIFIYRIITALLFLPFTNVFIKFLDKLVKENEDDFVVAHEEFFNHENAGTKESLEAVRRAVLFACDLSMQSVEFTRKFLETSDLANVKKFMQVEDVLNTLHFETKDYLIHIVKQTLDDNFVQEHNFYYLTITDIERIGDLCKNIVNLKETSRRRVSTFSTAGSKELNQLCDQLIHVIEEVKHVIEGKYDLPTTKNVYSKLETLVKFEVEVKERHYTRMCIGGVEAQTSVLYIEILTNLERAANHCYKIVKNKIQLCEHKN